MSACRVHQGNLGLTRVNTMAKRTSGKAADEERRLIEILRRKAQGYLSLPNITSVGVGKKIVNGKETDELSIQFTVERKLGLEALAQENIPALPKVIIADDGSEIPVDVIERSYQTSYRIIDAKQLVSTSTAEDISAADMRRSRLDTIMPGISISHIDRSAGTFGALVYDAMTGTPYILSNWHVLHGPTGALGDNIVQPGPHDDGNVVTNVMGRLVRSHLGVAGDCAVCSIIGRRVDDQILELDVVPKRVATVNIGDKVVKSGRTTGVTHGIVRRVGVVVNINYGGRTGVQAIGGFEIGVNPQKPPSRGEVSMGGDSGSLWLVDIDGADKDVAVGLHFAGETDPNPAAEHAMACAIHSVFQKLQISFQNPRTENQPTTPRTAPRRRRGR